MEIRPIRSLKDYEAALEMVSRLMEVDPDPGTPEGDMLDVLVTLVEAHEDTHYPIEAPDPIAASSGACDPLPMLL